MIALIMDGGDKFMFGVFILLLFLIPGILYAWLFKKHYGMERNEREMLALVSMGLIYLISMQIGEITPFSWVYNSLEVFNDYGISQGLCGIIFASLIVNLLTAAYALKGAGVKRILIAAANVSLVVPGILIILLAYLTLPDPT